MNEQYAAWLQFSERITKSTFRREIIMQYSQVVGVRCMNLYPFYQKKTERLLSWNLRNLNRWILTGKSRWHSISVAFNASVSEFEIGVAGEECEAFVDEAKRSLLREKDREVVGLSETLFDGCMSGKMGTIISSSGNERFAPKLFWGNKHLTDDLIFTEFGLGGNPPLTELALEVEVDGLSNFNRDEELSRVLIGISREDKLGRLDCCNKDVSIPFSSWSCF